MITFRLAAQVVINEIHYNPEVKTEPAEFIELYNPGTNTVNLSGWFFSDGVEYTFLNGIALAPGGYVVVAENPSTIQGKYAATALGPWIGNLDNDGERIVLRNSAGGIEDEVDYQLGFPWPTVGDPPGYSIELVNPAFDNNLSGSWRVSVAGNPAQQSQTLMADHSTWKFSKGTSEASSPTTAWRQRTYNDSGWPNGALPIGYDPSVSMGTFLSDMRSNYTTMFLRSRFVVDDPSVITSLILEALYDDGFKVWINDTNVLNVNMSTGEVPFDGTAGTAREDGTYNTFVLNSPRTYLVTGTNVIAVQAANSSLTASSDFYFDMRLLAQTGPSTRGPTPGAVNSVYATNLPPAIRQVDHIPHQPASGQPVTITAKITDPENVTGVTLQRQLVDPGNYIERIDAAYSNNWTSVPMSDAGVNGDALAGDSVYTAVLPGSVQTHRRLVRYRITATDGSGQTVTVPYLDDPQPNFAYFVYDGVPAWSAAVRPGVTSALNFATNVTGRLPVIHLIAKSNVVATATWFSRYGGDLYQWAGTLVYDGKVYDHVHYRARGGVWRYAMVKNMWKFDFNRGHDFEMRDDYGHKYKTRWTKLNLGASIQQGDYGHRGEQGMFESVGFKLFNLVDVESPNTTFVTFRVIDDAAEARPGDQYEGDFWGVYLAIEQEDGRFLEEHDLPDGNLYKMEGGTGELNNLGPLGPTDKSDLNYFLANYNGATDDWWRTNLDRTRYYSYQTMVQAIHHYDICYDKNFFYYKHPVTGLWSVHSWDFDLTWAHNMFDRNCGGIDRIGERFLQAFAVDGTGPNSGTRVLELSGARPEFETEFRNRIREIRDLLWNTDQGYKLIDEYAALLRGPTTSPTILDADRCMWDYNPKMTNGAYSSSLGKAGQGRFYQWPNEPSVSKTFDGCIQLLKNYIVTRSSLLDSLSADSFKPNTPSVSYLGPVNFPLNRLDFRSSAYAGSDPFAAMKWRIAEVTDTNAPGFDPTEPRKYEITADWESAELATFNSDITIPSSAVKVGHAYRVRVRMKDASGRWSNWSAPVQSVVGIPDNTAALVDNLRITELMYDPPAGSEYEFIELHNRSAGLTLDLNGANFTAGVDLTFASVTTIPPGGYLLVVNTTNFAAFRAYYALSASVPLVGPVSGNLANGGEKLELKAGAGGSVLFSFDYSNGRGWPVAANGAGHSLVPLDRAMAGPATGALDYPGNWRASGSIGGSPGRAEPLGSIPAAFLNEIVAHTDYSNPARPEYDSNDWIELYNPSNSDRSLADYYLSDNPANLRKWAIPTMTIPAFGFVTFDEVGAFHNPITSGFGLDKAGEQVLLSHLPGPPNDRVVDAVKFKGQENNFSLGRYADGALFWYPMLRTSNSVNSAGIAGVVINELMYRPPDIGTNDNTLDEFTELYNPTGAPITLQNTNGAWRLDGGISFDFPPNTTIPAGGTLLVVNFHPTNATALNAFRATYGITNPATILGPYGGKLGNRSDRVALEKPQYPDLPGDPYSWVIVDEVIYGNQNPWPTNANGAGDVLQRISVSQSGNDAANWQATAATPGTASGSNPDRDGDGMPNDWESANLLDPDDPSDADDDADNDGLSNLQEFVAGTNPRDAANYLKFDSVEAVGSNITLRFTASVGKSYTVQYRDNVASGAWQKRFDVSPQSTTAPVQLADALPAGVAERFYRLVTPMTP